VDAVAQHTMPFRLTRRETALVIVDMQYASASRTSGFGKWLDEQGRSEEGEYRFSRIEKLVVPNTRRLLEYFRAHSLSRVFVKLGAQLPECRDLIPHIRRLETNFNNIVGEPEHQILQELAPKSGEAVVTKMSASAFTSSNLDTILRNLEVRSLVFTGVSTSQCVDLTARDASDRGYQCIIVEDAVAEDRKDFHEATLAQFERLFGKVLTTDDVLTELEADP
jgi:nicotinamidase-related amidase